MSAPDPDQAIQAAHSAASRAGEPTYRDPATGFDVMTEAYLRERGYCCASGCRHCPYPGEQPTEPAISGPSA